MPIIIDPNLLHEFTIGDVKFRIKAMTGREMLALSGELATIEKNPDSIYKILHKCLKEWDGVLNTEGEGVPCTSEFIDALPVDISAQIFEKITSLTNVQGQEGN